MNETELYERYGWQSDLRTFSESQARVIRKRLSEFVFDASQEQVRAWDQSIPWLQRESKALTARDSAAADYTAILEYELPRESRRPDVIVLERGRVVVLEIKGHMRASQAAIDQALGYARDLAAYHTACAGRDVTPVLLIRDSGNSRTLRDGVYVIAPESLNGLLHDLSKTGEARVKIEDFLAPNAYAPLPSIVAAARDLFHRRPLPMIKRARAATEPALEYLTRIAHEAAATQTHHLVMLSGVPGSGKTLIGLQLVHAGWLDDLAVAREAGKPAAAAVYLSGNGPLVQVLQHALHEEKGGGKVFVQSIKNYVAHYSRKTASGPPEHLIVFDEAQRAHDAERVAKVHKANVGMSEPEHLLHMCDRIPEWSVLVALIGDGQAIHAGEENGATIWREAVQTLPNPAKWIVHGSAEQMHSFDDSGIRARVAPVLNLDTEIRFHLTPKVYEFVAGMLNKEPEDTLRNLADELYKSGHRFLLSRNLQAARNYLRERYSEAKEAKYGVLASSKDKWLPEFGIDNSFLTTRKLKVGPWYNAPSSSPESCCQLDTVATEFSSQGLELDFALTAWGSDLLWHQGDWMIEHSRGTRGGLKDPLALRKNVYRVLLTRGRDGTIVFVPPDHRLDATYDHLAKVGFRVQEDQ